MSRLLIVLRVGAMSLIAAVLSFTFVHACSWPRWAYHALVVSIGATLYLGSNYLIYRFIRHRAPDFISNEECIQGVQKWEITAGTGIVPKWVSRMGIWSIAFLLASPLELLAWLMRTVYKYAPPYFTSHNF